MGCSAVGVLRLLGAGYRTRLLVLFGLPNRRRSAIATDLAAVTPLCQNSYLRRSPARFSGALGSITGSNPWAPACSCGGPGQCRVSVPCAVLGCPAQAAGVAEGR